MLRVVPRHRWEQRLFLSSVVRREQLGLITGRGDGEVRVVEVDRAARDPAVIRGDIAFTR